MAFNKFYIKKWYRMLTGKSILHVNQNVGKFYDKQEIRGYYNDLREKVIRSNLKNNELPLTELPNGKKIYFPIAIFQYGLGAYDLYLETKKNDYYTIFLNAANWALNKQEKNGGWITFDYECTSNPYSSMAQGEGISLLLRAYKETNDKKYLIKSKKAFNHMKKDIYKNGCTLYDGKEIILKEFPEKPTVLNGWIFSLFGLFDYYIVTKDNDVKSFLETSIESLVNLISKFDIGYWSKYDLDKKIASPFYHRLHVELLKVLCDLTGKKIFLDYSKKFSRYQKRKVNKARAFIKKAYQKIKE